MKRKFIDKSRIQLNNDLFRKVKITKVDNKLIRVYEIDEIELVDFDANNSNLSSDRLTIKTEVDSYEQLISKSYSEIDSIMNRSLISLILYKLRKNSKSST